MKRAVGRGETGDDGDGRNVFVAGAGREDAGDARDASPPCSPKRGNGAPGTRDTTFEMVGSVTDADTMGGGAIARQSGNWRAGLDVARRAL